MKVTKLSSWQKPVSIAPLIVFRIVFGLMMLISTISLFRSTYAGFSEDLPDYKIIFLQAALLVSACCIITGLFFRLAAAVFFVLFSLLNILTLAQINFWYFTSVLSLIIVFLPANRDYALDVWRKPALLAHYVPEWTIRIVRLQVALLYLLSLVRAFRTSWLVSETFIQTSSPHGQWQKLSIVLIALVYHLLILVFLLNPKTSDRAFIFVLLYNILAVVIDPHHALSAISMTAFSLIFLSDRRQEQLLFYLPYVKIQNLIYTPGFSTEYKSKSVVPILLLVIAISSFIIAIIRF